MMRDRLVRTAGPYTLLRVLGQAAEFGAWVVLAHRLGPADLGELTVAFLICRYGGLVADWGASLRGVRDIALRVEPAAVHALVALRRRLSLVLAALYITAVVAAGHAELVPVAGTLLGRGLSRDWLALGRSRGARAGVPWALQGFVLALLAAAFVHDVGEAAAALGLAYLGAAALSVLMNSLPAVVASAERPASTLRPSGWGAAYMLAEQVCFTADALLLAAFQSTHDAGVYALVYRIPNAWTTVLLTSLAGALPAVAGSVGRDGNGSPDLRRRALRIGAIAAIVVALATAPAVLLVEPVLGADYRAGRAALAILMLATAIKSFAAPLQPLCVSLRSDRRIGRLMVAVAATNVAANLVLVPTVGMVGAAIATVVSESAFAGWLLVASRRPVDVSASAAFDTVADALAPDSRPQVDVVVLTWNDEDGLLDTAIESALASTDVDVRVIVVDNGSTQPAVVPQDSRVVLLRNEDNRGVAGGRNQGIRFGERPFVCLLDSDARLEPDCLAKLTGAMRDVEIAFAAPVFVGQSPEDSGGRAPTFTRKLARLTGRTSSYESVRSADQRQWDVDFAIGACQLFRRAAYDEVDGLDERYFYGPEDVDFCLRLKARGHRLVQVGDAACHHPPRRRHRGLLTRGGMYHATALCRHLWRHRGGPDPRPQGVMSSMR